MDAEARYPNTCGELLQGLVDGRRLLVSCPINRYSYARVRLGRRGPYRTARAHAKATLAVQAVLERFSVPGRPYELTIENPLPRARGYGTSTADLCAAAQAAARALGTELSPDELAGLALAIEPSDGTMYPGLVVFDHCQGGLVELLGPPPALNLVVLDPGGAVETEAFRAAERPGLLRALSPGVAWALELLRRGLREGDLAQVGRGATASAVLHQSVLPNRLLPHAVALARRIGALGVCRAHSGTVLGLLLPPDVDPEPVLRAAARVPGLEGLWLAALAGGGEAGTSQAGSAGVSPAGVGSGKPPQGATWKA